MRIGTLLGTFGIAAFGIIALSCSLPNLETAQCAEARNSVKRLYSLHFANQQTPTDEYLRAREGLLSERLAATLSASEPEQRDYFTGTDDFPKAFRVGTCTAKNEGSAAFQVVLLWRDDTRNEQNEVIVHTSKERDRWVIDSVEN